MTEAPLGPNEVVNEAVRADWEAETSTFERVRIVMKRTYDPQSADEIASRALTTPTTARKHLEILLENGFVTATSEPGRSATLYRIPRRRDQRRTREFHVDSTIGGKPRSPSSTCEGLDAGSCPASQSAISPR